MLEDIGPLGHRLENYWLTNFLLIWALRPSRASPGRRSPSACRGSDHGGGTAEVDRMLAGGAQHTSRPVVMIAGAPLLAKLVGTAISPRDQ